MFSNIGTNLLLVTTEGGYGVAGDHETGQRSYMKVAGAGLGIGIGAKDPAGVHLPVKLALAEFMSSSWAAGADADAGADAAAKVVEAGGEQSVTAKTGVVEIYTITRNGVALSATVSGTRFYRDGYLNSTTRPSAQSPPGVETADAN